MESEKSYKERIKRHTPPSSLAKDTTLAFVFGGGICLIGEIIATVLMRFGIHRQDSYVWVSVILILLSAALTSLGVFDNIAKHAGAGTLVPVTGFANSVVSAALDNREEGYVSGVGTKIFIVAGPVVLFSTVAGCLYGIIYYVISLFT